jgi:hypothetical protein
MTDTHIICNQNGHYWGRGKRWVDGRDLSKVAHYGYRDEAVNTVFELSSKDIDLRCDIKVITLIEGKLPKLTVSMVPVPDPEDPQLAMQSEAS